MFHSIIEETEINEEENKLQQKQYLMEKLGQDE